MRREIIVCNHCKAARDSKEPGGAILQVFAQKGTYVVYLCDACLEALDIKLVGTSTPGGSAGKIEFIR